VRRPSIHKTTTLLEQISAVANHMRQRRLGDLARKIGALGRPVSKRGSEAMGRQSPRPMRRNQRFSAPIARKHKISVSESLHFLEHRNGRTG
jgi:hypothetical protein